MPFECRPCPAMAKIELRVFWQRSCIIVFNDRLEPCLIPRWMSWSSCSIKAFPYIMPVWIWFAFLCVYTTVADLVTLTSMCQVRQYLYTMSTSFWSVDGTTATRANEKLPTWVAPRLLSSRVFYNSLIYTR